MAHILSFSIEGLAGRKETYAKELNRDINIFFGLNGSGKTSLLKILHSAMSGDASILRNVPFTSAEVEVYSIDFKNKYLRTIKQQPKTEIFRDTDENIYRIYKHGEIQIERELSRSYNTLNWQTTPKLPERASGGWTHQYLPTSRTYSEFENLNLPARDRFFTEDALDFYFAKSINTLWVNYYSDILAAVRKAQEDGLASILKDILSSKSVDKESKGISDISVAYNRVSAFLRRQGSTKVIGTLNVFKKQYENNPQLKNIVIDINEIEQKIENAMAPKDKLQGLIQNMYSGNKSVHFDDKTITVEAADKMNIGLENLSSGEKQVLNIFIGILRAELNSIIIDEPELSLHIDWQKQLISDMQILNPKSQIIIATHSPEIMADVNDDKIFRL